MPATLDQIRQAKDSLQAMAGVEKSVRPLLALALAGAATKIATALAQAAGTRVEAIGVGIAIGGLVSAAGLLADFRKRRPEYEAEIDPLVWSLGELGEVA